MNRKSLVVVLLAVVALGSAGGALSATPKTQDAWVPFPTPGPPTVVPSVNESGTDGPDWAYAYVNIAGVSVPAYSTSTLCSVTVGPGTWKFTAVASALINPRSGSVNWSLDLVGPKGTNDYYGASTGSVAAWPQVVSIPVLGFGSFAEPTVVRLRWWSSGDASFNAAVEFDSGPVVALIAERISDATADLP